jgi:hypothetical protein
MNVADRNRARAVIDPIVPMSVLAGVALWFVTETLSKTDIGDPGWTLRGNGSIAVLFAGGSALLTFGWLALAFGHRGHRRSLNRALLGAAMVLVLELVFVFAPIALGPADAPRFSIVLIVACLAAALTAGTLLARGGLVPGLAVAILALAASLAPLGLQFFLVPLFLPVVVAMPSLALSTNRWLLLNSVALFLALLLGLYGAQAVAKR